MGAIHPSAMTAMSIAIATGTRRLAPTRWSTEAAPNAASTPRASISTIASRAGARKPSSPGTTASNKR